MHRLPNSHPKTEQRGVALVIALALLVIITLIGLASMSGSLLEQRMATNEELRAYSFEITQSVVDAVLNTPSNTQVFGGIGRTICTANWPSDPPDPCNARTATIPGPVTTNIPAGATARANVVRLGPLLSPMPPGLGFSVTTFQAARFRVTAVQDPGTSGYGNMQLVQGAIVPVVGGTQTN